MVTFCFKFVLLPKLPPLEYDQRREDEHDRRVRKGHCPHQRGQVKTVGYRNAVLEVVGQSVCRKSLFNVQLQHLLKPATWLWYSTFRHR